MRRRVPQAAVIAYALAGLVAMSCADDERDANAPPATVGAGAGEPIPCPDGVSRECSINVGEHEGIVYCVGGTETCSEGAWSDCVPDGTMTAKAKLDFELNSLSTPSTCNNACDPSCMAYGEVPMNALTSSLIGPYYDWTGGPAVAGTSSEPCQEASDCQGDSYCVNPKPAATCEHSACSTGGPLDSGCDPCAAAICASNPSCCQQGTSCSTAYGGVAGFVGCADGETSTSCLFAMTNSTTSCQTACASGGGTCIEAADNQNANAVCSPDADVPLACSYVGLTQIDCRCTKPNAGDWTQACADLVDDVCGAFCDSATETAGTCIPWAPGETDATCGGIELTAGAGCDGIIVVCNRGTMTAPTGIEIAHYPQADGPYAVCNPALPGTASTCTTTEDILPGECINVTGCMNLTTGPRAVVVNPTGAVAECHSWSCANNWSLWNPGACNYPSCSVVYTSPTSCVLPIPSQQIVGNPGSVTYDNGVDAPSTMTQVASAAACSGSGLEWYWTDAAQSSITLCPATCTGVQNSIDQCDQALEFRDPATDRCYLYSHENYEWSTQRTNCQTWQGDLVSVTTATEQTFITNTILAGQGSVVAFVGAQDVVAEGQWGWVTGDPWIWTNWNTNEPAGGANPRDCLAMYQNGTWTDVDCSQVENRLCERPKLPKYVTITTPCPSEYVTSDHTETYEPNCGAGKQVQWGFLGWTTNTPLDSSVVFSFRTAIDLASLPSAPWVMAGTASAALNNQTCSINAPSANCPADLFEALDGLPAARYPVGEIRITTIPSGGGTNTPVVNDWTLTYSCVDSE